MKVVQTSGRNRKVYKNGKFRKAIFTAFLSISLTFVESRNAEGNLTDENICSRRPRIVYSILTLSIRHAPVGRSLDCIFSQCHRTKLTLYGTIKLIRNLTSGKG